MNEPLSNEQMTALALLREPFEPHQISKLPKTMGRDGVKAPCQQGTPASADGVYCGGYHARAIHIDYVGHAALTDRLLNVDPGWTWEPLAWDEAGLPRFDHLGGLWIRLTISGMTRYGYGDAGGKIGNNAIKEAIGDALRNAAMRFGAALDLWHKGDLRATEAEHAAPQQPEQQQPQQPQQPAQPEPQQPAAAAEPEGPGGIPAPMMAEIRRLENDPDGLYKLWMQAKQQGAPNNALEFIAEAGRAAATRLEEQQA